MNLLQAEYGVLPTKVMKEDKARYIQALIDTRESDDLEIFQNCMIELHCEQLKRDIDSFSASMEQDAGKKGGQKTGKVDRKGGQKTKNRSAVSKHMKQMQEQILVRRVGPDKGGHWEVCI